MLSPLAVEEVVDDGEAIRVIARLTWSPTVTVSFATALWLLRRIPPPAVPVPRVVGVDDFALRSRHRCATIIVDADNRRARRRAA